MKQVKFYTWILKSMIPLANLFEQQVMDSHTRMPATSEAAQVPLIFASKRTEEQI